MKKFKRKELNQFKNAFLEDYGQSVNDSELEDAAKSLYDFFELLYKYHLKQRRKNQRF